MIYSLKGEFVSKGRDFITVSMGGITFKVITHRRVLERPIKLGEEVEFFTYLHHKEDALDLYGFSNEEELRFFELLISVSGVGPKSALGILSVGEISQIEAAIKENRPDLLTKVSGIGHKTAERIIVELKTKVQSEGAAQTVARIESDSDAVEALIGLGYKREQAKEVLRKVPKEVRSLEEKVREALKILGRRS